MIEYIIKRIIAGIISLFFLITITFFLMKIIPGGPFSPAEQRNVPVKILEQMQDQYGLNDPLLVQYGRYLRNLLKGDLGISFKKPDTSVKELITAGFPASAQLGICAILLALSVGIPLGILSVVGRGKLMDGISMLVVTAGVSIPSFVICSLLMYLFCEKWRLLPSFGLAGWKHYLLPVFCLAFSPIAYIARFMRSGMQEVMKQDYIRTERSKGVTEFVVIGKYALKNAILPVVTYLGPLTASLLTGTFVIEKVFSIPGLGRYFVSAVSDRDYSVLLGLTAFLGTVVIICNLLADILYAVIDPRVKMTE